MPDTQRTLAALVTLLADNTSGAISAQDVRDIVETLKNGMGEIYVSTPADTVVAGAGTWYELAGTWTLSAGNLNWDHPATNQLRYTGTAPRMCHIACTIELDMVTGANTNARMAVALNGSPLVASTTQVYISTEHASTAIHAFTEVANGDILSIQVANIDGTEDLTADYANLFVMDMAT